ncbi:MAG: von Willebrand factor type [Chthonomonadaceae bacterium]|nr:von Willebrand factor type [Chthonomonadaceae bacterium]
MHLRQLARLTLILGLLSMTIPFFGCGSGKSALAATNAVPGDRSASLRLKITWPPRIQSIPAETNRIVLHVIAPDPSNSKAVILEQPSSGGTVEYTITGIWPGQNRLVTAEARKVAAPGTGVITDPADTQLVEGSLLASGSAGPIDLSPLATAAVSIALVNTIPPISNDIYKLSGSVSADPTDPSVIEVGLNALLDPVNGKPLTGLTADNFVVFEDSVNRSIVDVQSAGSKGGGKADIAFLIDTTGSMANEITGVKNSVIAFANHLAAQGFDVQLGGVSFGDEIRDTYAFTKDYAAFSGWAGSLSAKGGGDTPENDVDAIMTAVKSFAWRDGAQRVVVVITDATTHYLGDNDGISHYAVQGVINALQTGNFVLDSVSKGGTRAVHTYKPNDNSSPSVATRRDAGANYPDISTAALATGGITAYLPDDGSIDLSSLGIDQTILAGYVVRFRSIRTNADHDIRLVVKVGGTAVSDKDFSGHY